MATESPMRMVESGRATKCPSSKDAAIFGSPLSNMAAENLGLLVKGHRFHGGQTDMIPSRSGSAPPSMEGSFAAIGNLLAQQNLIMSSSLESLSSAIENCESEEQLRSDPAYFAYYCSNINLNPRLPPPLMSRENRQLVCRFGGLGNWRSASIDDSGTKSLQLSMLSTHKEEPEDDKSPRGASENSSAPISGPNTTSLAGRHKSLVDLIQEDFPRTPSPVYSQSRSSSHAAEEVVDLDTHVISPNVSSVNISKASESNSGSDDVCVNSYALEVDAIRLIADSNPTVASYPGTSCLHEKPKDTGLEGHASVTSTFQSGITRKEPKIRNNKEEQRSYGRNMPQNHPSMQQGNPHQAQRVQPQIITQPMNQSHNSMVKFSHEHPRISTIEVQPSLHSPVLNSPSYASVAAYMTGGTPFYPNFQPSGLYSPQYGMGGYALGSAFLPPFMTGYPSHGAIPVPFGASSPGYGGRTAASSAGENIPQVGGLQHLGKFYGQQGLMLQPSYVDPLYMQYFQNPFGDAYGASFQQNRLASSGPTGGQADSFLPQKESFFSTYRGDHKLQPPTNGSLSMLSPGKVGITGNSYYGGPPDVGVMTQFPGAPLASPVLPSSPVGGINHIGQQNDMRFPQGSSRNVGPYSGGHGQRGVNSFDEPKRHYFLEELKSSSARKFELSEIGGHIVEFSVDQHGSRFIQQKLEHCSFEEKVSVFKEVLPHASKLMTDVFGNYVIQKFFEHGSPEQRKELADKLSGQMLQLSLQMYGCRVIQKALEVIELDQKTQLVQELDGHVMRCVHDQNGNHVIQKCIECVPTKNIEFIISAFRGQVAALATHPYGCRVIQRVLEHCSDDLQSQCIVDEILDSAYLLAQDQYGNYVTQHVLERGKPCERSQIISKVTGKILQMSQHKYASNVIEKCLEHGNSAERELLIEEIIGQSEENDHLLIMMKDQFANYVVQKILEISNDKQREILLNRVRVHLHALKKYTYGKHIVARFEQLCGEESQGLET